jgi:hypothetical protein
VTGRLTIVAAAAAALVLAAAALADPLDPKVKIVPRDQAAARAALLTRADLGAAWNGGALATPSSLKAPVCPSLRPDYSKLTITGHTEARFDNGNGGFQVVADVEVWRTVAQATEHMGALFRPKLPTCIKYALSKSVGGTNVLLLPVKRLKIAKLADVTAHYRAPIVVKSGKQSFTVLSDFVFLRKGRTEIYLNVIAPSTDEQQVTTFVTRIARTVLKRVRV